MKKTILKINKKNCFFNKKDSNKTKTIFKWIDERKVKKIYEADSIITIQYNHDLIKVFYKNPIVYKSSDLLIISINLLKGKTKIINNQELIEEIKGVFETIMKLLKVKNK